MPLTLQLSCFDFQVCHVERAKVICASFLVDVSVN